MDQRRIGRLPGHRQGRPGEIPAVGLRGPLGFQLIGKPIGDCGHVDVASLVVPTSSEIARPCQRQRGHSQRTSPLAAAGQGYSACSEHPHDQDQPGQDPSFSCGITHSGQSSTDAAEGLTAASLSSTALGDARRPRPPHRLAGHRRSRLDHRPNHQHRRRLPPLQLTSKAHRSVGAVVGLMRSRLRWFP